MAAPSASPQIQFWSQAIARQARSGLTQHQFCSRHRLSIHLFRKWKYRSIPHRHLRPAATRSESPSAPKIRADTSAFLPVRLVPTPANGTPGPLELVLGQGRVVRVPPDFDERTLRRLVAALEGSSC